ncbi:MAG: hypothetical protein ACFB11_14440 [Paracoccaceae bacterium]
MIKDLLEPVILFAGIVGSLLYPPLLPIFLAYCFGYALHIALTRPWRFD